jgi:hypothetical protein
MPVRHSWAKTPVFKTLALTIKTRAQDGTNRLFRSSIYVILIKQVSLGRLHQISAGLKCVTEIEYLADFS